MVPLNPLGGFATPTGEREQAEFVLPPSIYMSYCNEPLTSSIAAGYPRVRFFVPFVGFLGSTYHGLLVQ